MIELYLIPNNENYQFDESFSEVINMLGISNQALVTKVSDYSYELEAKEKTVQSVLEKKPQLNIKGYVNPDEKLGFSIDYIENTVYDWEPKTSGPVFHINTKAFAFDYTVDLLKMLNRLMGNDFKIFDPQRLRFLN